MQSRVAERAVTIGVVFIIAIGLAVMGVVYYGIWTVKDSMRIVTDVEGIMLSDAYEMEINVIETGLAVLKYLDTRSPAYREQIRDDVSDFKRFHERYSKMADSRNAQVLATELGELFDHYRKLGEYLMKTKDDQDALYSVLSTHFERLDDRLDMELDRISVVDYDTKQIAKSNAVWFFGYEIAEIGAWLGSYLRTGNPSYRFRVFAEVNDVRDQLARFDGFALNELEQALLNELRNLFEESLDHTKRILAKYDAMHEGFQEFLALRRQMDDLMDEGIQVLSTQQLDAAVISAEQTSARVLLLTTILIPLSIACSVISAIVMRRALHRPLKEIRRRATAIAETNPSDRLRVRQGDEFGGLARDFNKILERLSTTTVSRNQLKLKQKELHQLNTVLQNEVTERTRAEQAFQALSHQLVNAQESERHRIARELHDEVGQTLTAIKINLDTIQQNSKLDGVQQLTDAIHIVDQLLQQVRTLSLELRPSVLDDLGLVAALRWLLKQQSQRLGFAAELRTDPELPNMPTETEITCFRIVQEALTNIVRHGQARQVTVDLVVRDDVLHLQICNDGPGFDVAMAKAKAARGDSMGLLSMQERAILAGGALTIQSSPDAGSRIELQIPIPKAVTQR